MPPPRATRAPVWLPAALVLAIGWFYFWTAVPEWRPGLASRQDGSYYNLLTRGFLQGRLSMDAAPDPYLATLAYPWDPAKRGDHGLPDASYYHGRYYLYYGVAPEVLLFLPFRLLTGRFLGEALAPPTFALLGLIASVWLLRAVRRRYFPGASEAVAAACVLALGLANMMPVLLRRPGFREIPIACGYACCMAALAALFQALHTRRPARWLVLAGLALGCAVGSRPLYLLVCPVVLLPVWLEARQCSPGNACWRDRGWLKLLAAAVLPLAAVGCGLALYNALRFGSPFEFGLRYQFWFEDPAKTQRFAWRFFTYNLQTYWLAPAGWTRYFPFVTFVRLPDSPAGFYGAEDPYGIIPNMPFALLALGAGVCWARGPSRLDRRLRAFVAGVIFAAGGMSLTMAFFQASLNRYMVDFAPVVVLLACLGLLALTARPWFRGGAALLGTAAAGALSLYSSGFNVLASLRHNELFRAEHPALYARVAHRWNWLSYEYDRWRGTRYGPIEMKVIFPRDRTGASEPLVVTGRAFLSDFLFVHYVAPGSVQFGVEHTSYGSFLSRTVSAAPGKPHTLRIDLGSLYPPAADPYFDALPPAEAQLRQETARVTLDGDVVLNHPFAGYEAAGPVPSIGSAGDRRGFGHPFSGEVLSWKRMSGATMDLLGHGWGALRCKLIFPPFTSRRSEPLVCAGETGRGDLVYVRYESPTRVSFGYDHWGVGGPVSPPFAVEPGAVQVIEIDSGSLHPAAPAAGLRGPLRIRLNGHAALDEPEPYYASPAAAVVPCANPIGSSVAGAAFTGEVVRIERRPIP